MGNSQNLTERVIKGGSIVLFFTFLVSPIGYFIRILYSHTLSIEMYGLFYSVLTLFYTISLYNDLGFGYSVAYFLPKYLKKNDYATSWNFYLYCQIIEISTAIFLSLLLILTAPWLSTFYFKTPEAKNLIYIFCIYLIASSLLNALIKVFVGLQKEKYYSSLNFFRMFFAMTFSFAFYLFKLKDITYYAAAWSGGYILAVIIYYFLLYKNNKLLTNNKLIWDSKLFKLMYSYAVPTLLTTSLYSFIIFSDTFFLTLFRGVREVAIYNIVLPLVSISTIFILPINNFIFPLVSDLMEGEKQKINKLIKNLLVYIPFVSLYFSLFIAIFPSTPVKLFFGMKWVGLVEVPLSVLAFGFIASSISTYFTTLVSGMGKVNERLKVTLIIAVTSCFLNAILIFYYGVLGTVIANSFIFIFSVFLYGKIIKKVVNFNYPLNFYLKIITVSIILYLEIWELNI